MTTAEHRQGRVSLPELDWLMAAVLALCCLGLVMAVSIHGVGDGQSPLWALREQGTKLVVATVVFLAAVLVPLSWFRALAVPWLVVGIGLCAAALLFDDSHGARRWILIGGSSLQPVELARFGLVLFSAAWIARQGDAVREFRRGFVALMGPAGALALVLVMQPDVGNAAFAVAIAAVMAVVGGVRLLHFILAGLPLLVPLLLLMSTHEHVQRRL